MSRGTRLFEFPGGMLELRSTESDVDRDPGVYLELRRAADRDHESEVSELLYRPTVLGYLRTDVSGVGQLWDETQIRRLAARLGYDFSAMVLYEPRSGRAPLARLKSQATRLKAEAVIVPSAEHFAGGQVPESLVARVDVITVCPEVTYSRPAVAADARSWRL